MLHVQSRRRNKRLFSPSLFESTHFVTIDLCSFWCTMSDGLSGQRGYLKLLQVLCWKKKEKRLGRLFRYTCFRPYKEREMGELLIIVKAWTK